MAPLIREVTLVPSWSSALAFPKEPPLLRFNNISFINDFYRHAELMTDSFKEM